MVAGLLRAGTPAGLLVATLAAQRLTGPRLTEQFALAQSWVMIGGLALTLGLGELALREAAPEGGDPSRFESWLSLMADRAGAVGTLLAIAMLISAPQSGAGWLLLSCTALAYAKVNEGLLRHRTDIVLALTPVGAIFPTVTVAVLLLSHHLGMAGYYAFAAGTVGAALSSGVLRHLKVQAAASRPPAGEGMMWLGSALRISVSTFAGVLIRNLDILVLALVAPTEIVAAYAILLRIGQVAALPLVALTTAFAPRLSRLVQRGDEAGAHRLIERIRWLATPGAAGIFAIIGVVLSASGNLVDFGDDGRLAIIVFVLLFIRFTGDALGGPVIPTLMFRSYESRTAAVIVVVATAHCLAAVVMGTMWGAVGVAAAGSASILTLNVKLNLDARRLPWINGSALGAMR